MRKLLNAQDLDTVSCLFQEEQAFLSALPLLKLEKSIYERSKRNGFNVWSCELLSLYLV